MIAVKDFYLVRTPLLPINFLDRFADTPFPQLHDQLRSTFSQPYMLEAIYIASPELYQELLKWQNGQLTGEKEVNKLVLALFRYVLRMCTRCTPYGLFAGCAMGRPAETSGIVLAPPDQYKKHCRLDMNYVAELTAMITRVPGIRQQLTYYPNNSMYKIADTYRYAAFSIKNKFRQYDLTSVNCTPYLDTVLATAAGGASIGSLCNSITSDDITEEEATEFIQELIDSQLLVSELEPTVTGEEFFTLLVKKLQALQGTADLTEKLINIQQLLQQQSASVDKYLQTHTLVKELLPDTNSKDLVQTDLFLATSQNTIGTGLMTDLQQQLIPLWKLSSPNNNSDLQNFCKAFHERYEDQEMPLCLVLDAEAGIGYAGFSGSYTDHTPLIDDIYAQQNNQNETKTVPWNKMQDFQLKQLQSCLHDHTTEIVLTDEDLEHLKETDAPVLPGSLYLMGSLLGKNAAAIDAGDYLFELSSCGGPSAANLLGRFCHGAPLLAEKVRDCLQEEAQNDPDCIYAEVIHLPEARTGNILLRPRLREHEIVYLGNGSVDAEHQIPLTDLMVSVYNNTVVLRSKKLNKRVIPRLSTAHNYRLAGLPAYRFLCDLQFQQLHSGLGWQWRLPNEQSFLPRVRYGKIILSKCTWTLRKKDYPELTAKDKNGKTVTDHSALLGRIREQLHLPRYVVIAEGDNELFIDMDSPSCLHLLANTLIKKEQVVLHEFLQTGDQCWIESAEGRYTNELIIPLKSTDTTVPKAPAPARPQTGQLPIRRFITGSEWLYIKIYCGTSSAERMLKTIIKPLTKELVADGIIDQWFFIRYSDPEHHIRVRFHHAGNGTFWQTVLERLYTAVQQDTGHELAYKIQTDTYEREVERYGTHTMEFSEAFFYYDSEAVTDCIDLLEGEEGEHYRWLLAARGVDMLLQDFGYTLPSKAAIMKRMQQSFFKEFGGEKALQTQLNDKYREHMKEVGSFLDPQKDAENEIEEAIALFTMRSMKLTAAIGKAGLANTQDTARTLDELLPSYIHMFLNRILLSNQRKHELVIYHFLNRYYDSQVAIHKKQLQRS